MATEKKETKTSEDDRRNELDFGSVILAMLSTLIWVPSVVIFYVIQLILSFWRIVKGREFSEDTGRELDLLTGHDANWTPSSPEEHPVSAAVFFLRGKLDYAAFAEKFSKDVVFARDSGSRTKYARLLEYVVYVNGFYYWKREKKFDINEHVIIQDGNPATEEELKRRVENLVNKPLPKYKSPWMIYIIPCVSEKNSKMDLDKTNALVFVFDHTILDATRVAFLFENELSDSSAVLEKHEIPAKSSQTRSRDGILSYYKKLFFLPLEYLSQYIHAEVSPLGRMRTTGLRILSWSDKADLTTIQKIAEKTNSSTTEVILACVAESLKSFLKKSDMNVPSAVRVAWNVCKQNPLKPDFKGSKRTQVMLDLPLDKTHKLDAIKDINDFFTFMNKSSLLSEWNQWLIKKTGNTLPSFWFHWIMKTTEASLMTNTMTLSPQQKLSVLGCSLEDLTIVAPYRGTAGGSVSIATYNGAVRVAFSVDTGIINDITNVNALMADWSKQINELAVELGVAK